MSTINIQFVDNEGSSLLLHLFGHIKFSQAVSKYQIISGLDLTDSQIYFFFDSKEISKDCDKTLSELGIENMSKIEVVKPIEVGSAPSSVINILEKGVIFVIFEIKSGGKAVTLKLRENMKFSEVVSMYYEQMDIDEDDCEFKFIFNGKNFDYSKTLTEIGIKNGSKILVLPINKIEGAGLSIKSILENDVNKGVSSKKKSGKKIGVYFNYMNDEPMYVKLKDNIMFCEVASQYCSQYGSLVGKKIEDDKVQFIFQGKEIKKYSHKTLAELGIKNNDHIFVLTSETITNTGNLSKEKEEKNNITKKYDLNIIYYDENLKNKENNNNCTFFDMNINGTFYGYHYFELFKIVCEKIKDKKKEFILISSGSCSQKVFDYCSNIGEIREYYIYCFNVDKYKPLMNEYPKIAGIYNQFEKLKGVYNEFNELKEKLYTISEIKMDNICWSNLIFFEDYSRIYIKLHYEFIRKYSLYKILKSNNYSEQEFLYYIEKKCPSFLDTAKQLFPDKNETIDYFLKIIDESPKTLNQYFQCDNNILDDNINKYVHNYTCEGFYYRYLNKFLREGNFEAFRKLSSHVAKFIFKLYDYREKNLSNQKSSNLYRRMYLNRNEIKKYEESIERVICFPAFTSTSINKDAFTPGGCNNSDELVLLIIEQNNTKSTVLISQFSDYPCEEEYLFLPFSFFKIKKVELKEGTISDPHIFYLIALNSEKPIEDMFIDFFKNVTDNLNPEGLDLLILCENKTKIKFNQIYYT